MNINLVFYSCILQKGILFLYPGDLQTLVLVTCLIIITVFPENSNENGILPELISTPHMRTCQKSQTSTVDFQRLVHGKFHGEISDFFREPGVNGVGNREVGKIHN